MTKSNDREYRFFIHYNKPATQRAGKVQLSVHYRNTCYIVDQIKCKVPTEGKTSKRQPRFVMQGFAKSVDIADGVAIIV